MPRLTLLVSHGAPRLRLYLGAAWESVWARVLSCEPWYYGVRLLALAFTRPSGAEARAEST
ncbi:MAG: hypothetical protein ACE5LS_05970 [Thermoplasmata archaeon]